MTGNQKCDESRSTLDNRHLPPWSDLNHDALNLVMMKLGVVDFISFSGVCKPWRSHALYNRKRFMASKPPMSISFSEYYYAPNNCFLTELDGRVFKSKISHVYGRTPIGSTCGYLILFGNSEFWLVNPITRHELHFPNVHFPVDAKPETGVRTVLVFSPLISGWVFAILNRTTKKIWFSTSAKGTWDYVSSSSPFVDLRFFKGKIYAINLKFDLYEVGLIPQPNLILLANHFYEKKWGYHLRFVRSGENFFVMDSNPYTVYELDFGEMKWVLREDAREKYAFFYSAWELGGALRAYFQSQHINLFSKHEGFWLVGDNMWYFPHECLNYDVIDV